jgi:hypothetical protein
MRTHIDIKKITHKCLYIYINLYLHVKNSNMYAYRYVCINIYIFSGCNHLYYKKFMPYNDNLRAAGQFVESSEVYVHIFIYIWGDIYFWIHIYIY